MIRNILRKIVKSLLSLYRWQIYIIKYHKAPPPVHTTIEAKGLKVHIGSGNIDLKGWINIDGRDFDHIHIVSDNLDLNEFSNNAISEIYMCHIIEHVSFADVENIFRQFYKKLSVGGVLRISVPDFRVIADVYCKYGDIDLIKHPLMGGQDYSYNFHKSIFDYDSIKSLFEFSGYKEVERWTTEMDFGGAIGDWSNGVISTPDGNRSISLNVKAVKVK
jgi:predicted SAM-dependent methyltransferase